MEYKHTLVGGYWDVVLCLTNGGCILKATTNSMVAVYSFFQASADDPCDGHLRQSVEL